MQFLVYAHLSDEERGSFIKKNPDDRIIDNFKKLFRKKLNVYVPEQIPDTYNGARQYRNDLAHLLEIAAIEGDPPNRTMKVVRYDEYTTCGEWARQNKRTVDLAEADLRDWTDELRRCRTDINVMVHIAGVNQEFGWPDIARSRCRGFHGGRPVGSAADRSERGVLRAHWPVPCVDKSSAILGPQRSVVTTAHGWLRDRPLSGARSRGPTIPC